ncbi:hypothetical protein QQ045_004121 [Rhodiola kirilowii]
MSHRCVEGTVDTDGFVAGGSLFTDKYHLVWNQHMLFQSSWSSTMAPHFIEVSNNILKGAQVCLESRCDDKTVEEFLEVAVH